MEKIRKELVNFQRVLALYDNGTEIHNDANNLAHLESIAEQLVYEVAYYKTKVTIRERVRGISLAGHDKAALAAKKEQEGESNGKQR